MFNLIVYLFLSVYFFLSLKYTLILNLKIVTPFPKILGQGDVSRFLASVFLLTVRV